MKRAVETRNGKEKACMPNHGGRRWIALLVVFVGLFPAYFTGMFLVDVISRS